jgi:hypothetical protein
MDQPCMKDFKNMLEEIDLEFRIEVLDKLVKEQTENVPISVKRALLGVNDILVKIEMELKTVKKSIENHNKKWFKSWRRFNCSCNANTLKKHNKLLMKRSQILTDLLIIYGKQTDLNKKKS